MLQLPNACYCSPLKVHPSNWKTTKASLKKVWFIYYRFYDPVFKNDPRFAKGKLVRLKGMNHYKTLPERQKATSDLLDEELDRLQTKGYHPITEEHLSPAPLQVLRPSTNFVTALQEVEKRIQASKSTKRDLRSILNFVEKAAGQLRLSNLPVQSISRKHIKVLLTQIEVNRGSESPHRYNKVRSYLMLLFKELVELEVVSTNPVREISKKHSIQPLRSLLTPKERKQVDEYLKTNQYRFWLFTHIFFHSGARLTEMMQVKFEDVNLHEQTFVVTVKKGKVHRQLLKPIKDIALPYWKEALKEAEPGEYVFSEGLRPGSRFINSDQITKRWNRHIKTKLGVSKDFYSLKHLNLDETAALLSIKDAAVMASHTSTGVTLKHYAVGEQGRQQEKLRSLHNPFV